MSRFRCRLIASDLGVCIVDHHEGHAPTAAPNLCHSTAAVRSPMAAMAPHTIAFRQHRGRCRRRSRGGILVALSSDKWASLLLHFVSNAMNSNQEILKEQILYLFRLTPPKTLQCQDAAMPLDWTRAVRTTLSGVVKVFSMSQV